MSRPALFFAFLMLAAGAQAQLFSGAPPASATSPTPDGRTHGVPASVVSPNPPPFLPGHGPISERPVPHRPFGSDHRRDVFIPVPLFYPIYNPGFDSAYPSAADPATDPSGPVDSGGSVADSEEALRQAYLQGVRDAMSQQQPNSRYGQHYMDSRENLRKSPAPSGDSSASGSPAKAALKSDPKPEVVDDGPPAVFIFKDGHQVETRNYAIMGQTLYDFSGATLRRVQLTDLDTAATAKANDDRGVTVKLP